jgi:hypothetical protein
MSLSLSPKSLYRQTTDCTEGGGLTREHCMLKGNQNEAELKSWMTLALFAINHTVKEMILFVAILVSHGLIGTARS